MKAILYVQSNEYMYYLFIYLLFFFIYYTKDKFATLKIPYLLKYRLVEDSKHTNRIKRITIQTKKEVDKVRIKLIKKSKKLKDLYLKIKKLVEHSKSTIEYVDP